MADHPLLTNYMLGSDFTSNNLCMIKVDASITEIAAQNNMDLQIPCLPGRTFELFNIINSHGTVRLPQPEITNYVLSVFNESVSEKFPQGPPLKFYSASFGGIIQNRK